MRVAMAQPKAHPNSELCAEDISSSHTLESDRKPARGARTHRVPSKTADKSRV